MSLRFTSKRVSPSNDLQLRQTMLRLEQCQTLWGKGTYADYQNPPIIHNTRANFKTNTKICAAVSKFHVENRLHIVVWNESDSLLFVKLSSQHLPTLFLMQPTLVLLVPRAVATVVAHYLWLGPMRHKITRLELTVMALPSVTFVQVSTVVKHLFLQL